MNIEDVNIEQLTNKCLEEGIDFEIKSTFWEDPENGKWNEHGRWEGKVLFSMKNIWWLQENNINPYHNHSYNRVPPTAELSREKQGKSWLLVVGTSITNQALDVNSFERRTKVKVTKRQKLMKKF